MTEDYSKKHRVCPIQFRVTESEREDIHKSARAAGKSLVDYFLTLHDKFGHYGHCPACDRKMVPLKNYKLCYMCSEDTEGS